MNVHFDECKKIDFKKSLEIVRSVYNELPFNRLLGLEIVNLEPESAELRFLMKKELIGNYVHGILHGGVISAVLDTTGGMIATTSAIAQSYKGCNSLQISEKVARIGTIDMRVDYLRPGKGTKFSCTGKVLRTGNKVAVTRMELKNQDNIIIAVGTGTYMIG